VVGEGLPALWTRRALERAGFSVTASGTTVTQVTVSGERWTLTHDQRIEEYTSIYNLIEAIRHL
jgi:hypothetical protein